MRAVIDAHGELALTGLTPVHHAMLIKALQQLDTRGYTVPVLAAHYNLFESLKNPIPSDSAQAEFAERSLSPHRKAD